MLLLLFIIPILLFASSKHFSMLFDEKETISYVKTTIYRDEIVIDGAVKPRIICTYWDFSCEVKKVLHSGAALVNFIPKNIIQTIEIDGNTYQYSCSPGKKNESTHLPLMEVFANNIVQAKLSKYGKIVNISNLEQLQSFYTNTTTSKNLPMRKKDDFLEFFQTYISPFFIELPTQNQSGTGKWKTNHKSLFLGNTLLSNNLVRQANTSAGKTTLHFTSILLPQKGKSIITFRSGLQEYKVTGSQKGFTAFSEPTMWPLKGKRITQYKGNSSMIKEKKSTSAHGLSCNNLYRRKSKSKIKGIDFFIEKTSIKRKRVRLYL